MVAHAEDERERERERGVHGWVGVGFELMLCTMMGGHGDVL